MQKALNDFEQFLLKWLIYQTEFNTNNLLILVTEEEIEFNTIEEKLLRKVSSEILIPILDKEKNSLLCRKLLKHYFGSIVYVDSSSVESNEQRIQEDKLFDLTGGHPNTIRTLADFCKKSISVEEILENDDFQYQFLSKRRTKLNQFFSFTSDEKRLLEFLCLFDKEFDVSAIEELFPNPFDILEQFTQKMYFEKKLVEGKAYFSLPRILKNHILFGLKEKEKEIYRNRISKYYEMKDLKSP